MVKTIVLFDAPKTEARHMLESVLRANGYAWLLVNARWSPSKASTNKRLVRQLRSRLAGYAYRVLIVEVRGRMAPDVRWVTSSAAGRL